MNETQEEYGEFCRIFGPTPKNKIIEEYLTCGKADYPINGIAENTGVKKSTAYKIAAQLIEKKYLVPTRKIGGMQFYKLNAENKDVQLLFKIFNMILDKITEEYTPKKEIINLKK
ncbi:MAG TPA: hypothetical protein VJB87_00755 [Candidatus Nanoarchaeia archaeon]|nr:hypothetical protein [Candidatus Nanoarchaeia archaeon]